MSCPGYTTYVHGKPLIKQLKVLIEHPGDLVNCVGVNATRRVVDFKPLQIDTNVYDISLTMIFAEGIDSNTFTFDIKNHGTQDIIHGAVPENEIEDVIQLLSPSGGLN